MFLIKQPLHEWVTVISTEEDTWWGWSVVLAFVTWCVFASEAEWSMTSCVPPPQWRQQSGKSADYEEDNGDTCARPPKHTDAPRYFHVNAYCTISVENIWVRPCSAGRAWAWVLQCYYYRKPLLPLGVSPPSCSHLILSYITPVSNSILDPEVSSAPDSDAIIGFAFVNSSQ